MAKNIYVGNISYTAKEENLGELFAQYGDVVSVKIITDRETGKSKGFGFVEMNDEQAAAAAISALDGAEFGGRKLKVNPAMDKPRPQRTGGFRD
jgi:RNA recognition motif-containing protein